MISWTVKTAGTWVTKTAFFSSLVFAFLWTMLYAWFLQGNMSRFSAVVTVYIIVGINILALITSTSNKINKRDSFGRNARLGIFPNWVWLLFGIPLSIPVLLVLLVLPFVDIGILILKIPAGFKFLKNWLGLRNRELL